MVPGTMFGTVNTPVFRNILVEDPPNVLLSLKIVFPECDDPGSPRDDTCNIVDLTLPSVLQISTLKKSLRAGRDPAELDRIPYHSRVLCL